MEYAVDKVIRVKCDAGHLDKLLYGDLQDVTMSSRGAILQRGVYYRGKEGICPSLL